MKIFGVLFILSLPLAAQNTIICAVPPPTINGYTVTFPSTVTCSSSAQAAAAPVFSPEGGTFGVAQTVSLSSATPGAVIYYTTDRTAPIIGESDLYTGPISVTSTTAIKAISIADGYSASQISGATFTITAPPPVTAAIDCPHGFAASGSCQANNDGGPVFAFINGGGGKSGLEGSSARIVAQGDAHAAQAFNYQTAQVDVRAFTAIFTFVPDGQNVSFVLNNSSNSPYFNGKSFVSGAGCEAGFFQAYSQPAPPNHVFALELDSYSPLDKSNPFGPFVNSSVQIYQSDQSPCLPNDSGNNYPNLSKISTAPVALNSPANKQNTTTGDTYSATLTYDGLTLTLSLYDVTAGGACPGSACFTHTWSNVDIPSLVGGTDAWVGFTGSTGNSAIAPLYVKSFVYSGVN